MRRNQLLVLLFLTLSMILAYYVLYTSQQSDTYINAIMQERSEKDQQMIADDAPLAESRDQFAGLDYFDIDNDYRVNAKLDRTLRKKVVMLATSDGSEQLYRSYAYAVFKIQGNKARLLILEDVTQSIRRGSLLLAFADVTSAKTTYGGGRYIDVKATPRSQYITLDFNRAYNPYCAYSKDYVCPLPPKENVLPFPIYAGEKDYVPSNMTCPN